MYNISINCIIHFRRYFFLFIAISFTSVQWLTSSTFYGFAVECCRFRETRDFPMHCATFSPLRCRLFRILPFFAVKTPLGMSPLRLNVAVLSQYHRFLWISKVFFESHRFLFQLNIAAFDQFHHATHLTSEFASPLSYASHSLSHSVASREISCRAKCVEIASSTECQRGIKVTVENAQLKHSKGMASPLCAKSLLCKYCHCILCSTVMHTGWIAHKQHACRCRCVCGGGLLRNKAIFSSNNGRARKRKQQLVL